MKLLLSGAILALAGFGVGLMSYSPSPPMPSQSSAQAPAAPAQIVPLMAVYDNRSANPDGSGVHSVSYLIAVRKDGARAMISTDHFGNGWLKTRRVYDPAAKTGVDIHDDLGIKTTWPGQPTDVKSIIVPSCPQLVGGQTIELLGHKAVQDWHFVDTGGDHFAVINGWRIPELGCLRATTVAQDGQKDGSDARNVEDRLVWLSQTDPPDSFFEVSSELEEASPLEQFQRYIRAGLFSESQPVLSAWNQSEVTYSYFHGRIDRPTAFSRLQEINANQVPGQP